MQRLASVLVPALLATSAGCSFYFGDDDCEYGGGEGADQLVVSLRNPYTGQCEDGGGGGGGGCGDYEAEPPAEPADWAACYGACEGLDELGCQATPGCRAAYASSCLEWEYCTEVAYTFYGCWGTAPSGAIQGGGCEGLDAYQCSRHDDCIAQHYAGSSGCGGTGNGDCAPIADPALIGNFQACAPEPSQQTGCYDDWECPSGQTCNSEEVCLPGPYACNDSNGGQGESDAEGLVPCDNRCYGWCVPVDPLPGNCYEPALCDMVPPTCPEGTLPGVSNGCYTGYCIPVGECPDQPPSKGNCYEEVWCDVVQPTCPEGELPGVLNHCYTGYCVPVAECPDPPPACEAIWDENACLARADCEPVYQGIDCVCGPDGCVCQDYVFQYCSSTVTTTDSP